jgi:hypothetical protein
MGDPVIRTGRSWRWLQVRIEGLLSKPPVFDATGTPRFTTRIQSELWQPPPAPEQWKEAE